MTKTATREVLLAPRRDKIVMQANFLKRCTASSESCYVFDIKGINVSLDSRNLKLGNPLSRQDVPNGNDW